MQSPALRLIVEREQEIEKFKTHEYWTVHLDSHKGKQKFSARLIQYRGEKIEQFTIVSEDAAARRRRRDREGGKGTAKVVKVERKPKLR